jgi:hypothetical protein
VLARNNKTLFCGTDKGDVMMRNFPLKTQEMPFAFPVHMGTPHNPIFAPNPNLGTGSVSRLCVTHDDAAVFSAGEDGVLWMLEQSPPDRRGAELPVRQLCTVRL